MSTTGLKVMPTPMPPCWRLESSPALVLSDIEMEGIDGFGLRQQLMKDPKMKGVPFIFLTGHQDQWTQSRAGALGIDDFLVKPITKQDLLLAVSRVLQRSEQLKSQWGEQLDQRMTSALRPLLPVTSIGDTSWRCKHARPPWGRGLSAGQGSGVVARGCDGPRCGSRFAHAYAGYLRGLLTAHDLERAPARLLTILSNAVHSDPLLGATLLTTLCIELGNEGRVQWASAGHPAPGWSGPAPSVRSA